MSVRGHSGWEVFRKTFMQTNPFHIFHKFKPYLVAHQADAVNQIAPVLVTAASVQGNAFLNNNEQQTVPAQNNSKNKNPGCKKRVNIPALVFASIGTLIPLLFAAKRQKTSIFKIDYNLREMFEIGFGAVAAGLLGGIAINPQKTCEKLNEATFQLINMVAPLATVGCFNKIIKNKPNIKSKYLTPGRLAAIVTGALLAEIVSNRVNEKVNAKVIKNQEHCKKRQLKPCDFLVHLDDIILAISISFKNISNKLHISTLLPFCYLNSGYQVGKAE